MIHFTLNHVLFIFFTITNSTSIFTEHNRCIPLPAVVGCRKETTPSLRNFLPYQAKTVLSAPRRYRSYPSELPAAILNRGSFRFVYPFGYEYLRLMTKGCHAVPISIGIVSASHHKEPKKRIEQSSPPFKGGESPRSRAGVVLVHTGQHHPVSCCALCAPCCHPSSMSRGTDSVT